LLAAALAVLPLAFFLVAAHELFNRQATDRTVAAASQSGRLAGRVIAGHANENIAYLRAAEAAVLLRATPSDAAARLARLYNIRPVGVSIALYGTDGKLRAHAPASAAAEPDVATRDWFSEAMRTGKPVVSAVYTAATQSSEQLVAVAVPLVENSERAAGVLVQTETLQQFTAPLYALTSSPNTSIILLVDPRGRVFGKDGEGSSRVAERPEQQRLLQRLSPPPRETPGTRITTAGGDRIVSYSPINVGGWGVMIELPVAVVRSSFWVYERGVAILGGIMLALGLVLGFLVARLYKRLRESTARYLQQIESQNRQLELRSREAERATLMKSRFLATMSHELRTPLNAILGFAALLHDEPSLPVKQRRWAEHIREAGRHLLQLINDVLDLSRIEAGRLELNREIFAAELAVPEVASVLAPLVAAKELSFTVELDRDLFINADRIRFKQVLYNLLSNAVKFTPLGGEVRLTAQREGELVRFLVQDNGIGIAGNEQAAIFEEFHRADTTHSDDGGAGLGLAITRRLVEQHGGTLTVRSTFGEGSTFSFTLPAARVGASRMVSASPGEPV
jgi:signal transduction histidine kinase